MTAAAYLDESYLDRFARRLLADAYAEATARYWRRRAETFEAAAHRAGIDWPGHATALDLDAQRARCQRVADACRARAAVETNGGAGSDTDPASTS
jgi:hypothetical protein